MKKILFLLTVLTGIFSIRESDISEGHFAWRYKYQIGLDDVKFDRMCGNLNLTQMEQILDGFLKVGKIFSDNGDTINVKNVILTLKKINECLDTEGAWESNWWVKHPKPKRSEMCCTKYEEFVLRSQHMANSRIKKLQDYTRRIR